MIETLDADLARREAESSNGWSGKLSVQWEAYIFIPSITTTIKSQFRRYTGGGVTVCLRIAETDDFSLVPRPAPYPWQ